MRWWDDLWLNEAFASFASTLGVPRPPPSTPTPGPTFLADEQTLAYGHDMGPASHPIRTNVPDVGHAFASFDAITYFKGQAVLAQLMAYVSRGRRSSRGCARYFRDHAWGNAELSDLMGAIGAAADRDLAGWTASWLDQAGTDTISLVGTTLLASSPDGGEPRRHALRVGSYVRTDDGLERRGELDVRDHRHHDVPPRPAGGRPAPAQRRRPDLRLGAHRRVVAPGAAGRGGPAAGGGQPGGGRRHGLGHAGQGRAVDRRLPRLRAGRAGHRAEPRCRRAVLRARAARRPSSGAPRSWCPAGWPGWPRWPPPGRTSRTTAPPRCTRWRGPPRSPSTSSCSTTRPTDDVDLAWRVMIRRASLGRYDEAAVAELLARDPDPTPTCAPGGHRCPAGRGGQGRGLGAALAGPGGAGRSPDCPTFARCFWRPVQHELLVPVGAPLPRRGHRRLRRRAARPGRHGPRHASRRPATTRGWTGPGTSPTATTCSPSYATSCCSPAPTRSPGCSAPAPEMPRPATLTTGVSCRSVVDVDRLAAQPGLVDREAQLLLPLDRGTDQPGEQRVRPGRAGAQLGVGLGRDVVGVLVARQLDELDQGVVRRRARRRPCPPPRACRGRRC